MRAYAETYLLDAMAVLGEAFDCSANRASMPLQEFFELFVSTGVAEAFGSGAPRYVAGASGAELFLDVCYRAGVDADIGLFDLVSDGETAEYWCGWALAYWQWASGRPFRLIAQIATMDEVLALYPALHEAPEQKFAEVMESRALDRGTALKAIRSARGLTQAELAEASGLSLRAIQQYEQRFKNINHAQAASLCRLARTLGCRIEDLLEYPLD